MATPSSNVQDLAQAFNAHVEEYTASTPKWKNWYYNYLLDTYVKRVIEDIKKMIKAGHNSLCLAIRYKDKVITRWATTTEHEHFGKFVTLCHHGRDEIQRLLSSVKVSSLQYGPLHRLGKYLGHCLYFQFSFQIDDRIPAEPNHDLEFQGEGTIKELLFS